MTSASFGSLVRLFDRFETGDVNSLCIEFVFII